MRRPLVALDSVKDYRQGNPSQEDINEQLKRLDNQRMILRHLIRQAEAYGGQMFAPLGTFNGISETRRSIWEIKAHLRGWGVAVKDLLDEELPDREQKRFVRWPAVVVTIVVLVSLIVVLFLMIYPGNLLGL